MLTVVIELWAILCAVFDLRKREVPNWLTLPVLVGAIGWRLFNPDAYAFLLALVTLTLWLLGWLSGGDAKGLMALGLLDPRLYAWAWVGAGIVGVVW
ncbi:MAG: prepilin peptidase [Chloroflexi bacterium]|nr:prepilin peptidase [Chloroflexota bacterium]